MPGIAAGGDLRELHIEASYAGQAVSYNLYKNDIFVCNRPSDSELVCIVELDATPMDFVLTAVDERGVESMPSAPFILDPLPQANFVATVSPGSSSLSVHFDASTSSEAVGGIVRYVWDFGDGRFGTGQYIDHTFAAAGSYAVRLTVVNDVGVANEKANCITLAAGNPMQAITYRWDYPVASPGLAGFRLYMNGARICETSNPTARSLTCNVPISDGERSFYVTAIGAKGVETSPSNRLQFVAGGTRRVASVSGSASMQVITYRWDYPVQPPGLIGFRLYMNGTRVCETANPTARVLACNVPKRDEERSFYLTAIGIGGKESNLSNQIKFVR